MMKQRASHADEISAQRFAALTALDGAAQTLRRLYSARCALRVVSVGFPQERTDFPLNSFRATTDDRA